MIGITNLESHWTMCFFRFSVLGWQTWTVGQSRSLKMAYISYNKMHSS